MEAISVYWMSLAWIPKGILPTPIFLPKKAIESSILLSFFPALLITNFNLLSYIYSSLAKILNILSLHPIPFVQKETTLCITTSLPPPCYEQWEWIFSHLFAFSWLFQITPGCSLTFLHPFSACYRKPTLHRQRGGV